MKKILTLFFTVTVIGLGVLCITQSRRLSGNKEQLADLKGELERQDRRAEELRATNQRLKKQHHESPDPVNLTDQHPLPATSTSPAAAPGEASSPPESEKPDQDPSVVGKLLSKMMQDPDTRKFIRNQQRQMMDSLYGPLIK